MPSQVIDGLIVGQALSAGWIPDSGFRIPDLEAGLPHTARWILWHGWLILSRDNRLYGIVDDDVRCD